MDLMFVICPRRTLWKKLKKKKNNALLLICALVAEGDFPFPCAFPLPRAELAESHFIDSIANALCVNALFLLNQSSVFY